MNILVAFDKFKDSMTAAEACAAASHGARQALGEAIQITQAPLTDGGEGFCPILTNAANGYIEHHTVCGPLGEDVEAPLGWVELDTLSESLRRKFGTAKGQLAIIEMASAAGLEQVPNEQRHPKHCTTRGVGELIRIATAKKAGAILLGIGGSATSDLGLGALQALGIQFPNADGDLYPKNWASVNTITGFFDFKLPPIYIACDVDNPLLGERGAAAVYGPQKGLLTDEVESFDAEASRLASLLCQHFGQSLSLKEAPGAGAAGGIGFGLKVACGAEFIPGFELVESWLDLTNKVAFADLILTGEGKFDNSSLAGKGPFALITAASETNTRTIVLAGKAEDDASASVQERFPNCTAYSITPNGQPLELALKNGAQNLTKRTTDVLNQA